MEEERTNYHFESSGKDTADAPLKSKAVNILSLYTATI